MIYRGSRYQNQTVFAYDISGTKYSTVLTRPLLDFYADELFPHMVSKADRLDVLAHEYYGSAGKWWVIADANADVISDPFTLPVGYEIMIPKPEVVARLVG